MFVNWMTNFREMMGGKDRGSRKERRGFTGTPFVKVFETLDKNPLKSVYIKWEADMIKFIE